jgi:hypothetical protein
VEDWVLKDKLIPKGPNSASFKKLPRGNKCSMGEKLSKRGKIYKVILSNAHKRYPMVVQYSK